MIQEKPANVRRAALRSGEETSIRTCQGSDGLRAAQHATEHGAMGGQNARLATVLGAGAEWKSTCSNLIKDDVD